MPFDDSKKKLESKSNFELSVCLISSIINIAETNSLPFFIIGDFNADLKRDRPFDKTLKKFILDYDLESIIENFVQKTTFTYYHYNNNVKHTHNLDHILTSKVNTNSIKTRNCTILDIAANMSDHNA
jgi:endonuclease/exonuclease/phosphatase family metal-dependent hydrolase